MRIWVTLLGGLLVWALHFFALYAVGSIFLTTDLARCLTIVLTVACLGIVGLVGLRAWQGRHSDAASRWVRIVALWGVLIGAIAILWQGFVAVLI
ncbi:MULTISPECIES: hypothetical protein [Sphingobium]|uniref:hypothetical protein n=1 Tax=Sphingobium sp. MI1205 TaxID=407020 RepID=UPI00076FDF91|nr:hypothetical protein [Sphingobium sp. MI1205]AMK17339.1 hypothetical protein K663_04770 [Sphingobium sp. MI1205]